MALHTAIVISGTGMQRLRSLQLQAVRLHKRLRAAYQASASPGYPRRPPSCIGAPRRTLSRSSSSFSSPGVSCSAIDVVSRNTVCYEVTGTSSGDTERHSCKTSKGVQLQALLGWCSGKDVPHLLLGGKGVVLGHLGLRSCEILHAPATLEQRLPSPASSMLRV